MLVELQGQIENQALCHGQVHGAGSGEYKRKNSLKLITRGIVSTYLTCRTANKHGWP